jgi:hypothetical protein
MMVEKTSKKKVLFNAMSTGESEWMYFFEITETVENRKVE